MRKRGMTRRELEITNINDILNILDNCKYLHLGLVDGDEPYVVPLNYGYTMEDEKLTLYMHCATRGYKLDLINANPKVFFTMNCDVAPFEGEMPCQYGTAYKCLMGRGTAEVVEDPSKKMEALSIFMKTQTNLDFQFTEKLVSAVSIIKVDVSEYTAKARIHPLEK